MKVDAARAATDTVAAGTQGQPPAPPGVTVVREIGRGAQSVVYQVRRAGGDYAMKVRLDSVGAQPESHAAFRREAALLASADHPRLATVHDVGEVDGRPYLIMDLIDGATLASTLRSGPLAGERIVALGAEIADILAAVHRVGLNHRDIKPDNILLLSDGSATLIDLGMAARGDRESGGQLAGTAAYAAPEQSGILKRPVGPRSDLYALGAVLYECAAGRAPFVSRDVGELLRMHATATPPDLREQRRDLAPALLAVIDRLLAKDPDDRYADCAALIADLRAVAAGSELPSRTALRRDDPARVPLVGRDGELAELTAQWDQVRGGAGRVVTVRGPAGTGKSRLIAELHRSVAAGGAPVLVASCVEGATPMAPLVAAVEDHVAHLDAHGDAWIRTAAEVSAPFLRRLSPVLATALASVLDEHTEPAELPADGFLPAMSAFVTGLAEASGGAVLIVDDAHLCDGATARVLRQIQTELADTPLLLIWVTTTDDDAVAAPSSSSGPTRTPDLEITLGPLGREALVALAAAVTGRFGLGPDLLERIVARGGGTPEGVLEYVGAVIDAGLLVPHWGAWVLDVAGLEDLGLPDDTLGLLVRRIDSLGTRSRALLAAAAVTGLSFGVRLPALIRGLPQDECGALFDAAVAHGVLERRADRYTFVHARIRRALLDATADDERRDLHDRAAELVDRGDHPDEVTYLYARARHHMSGHPDHHTQAAYTACLAAGRSALDEYAAADAVRFLRFARGCAGPQSPAARAVLHESLGTAYHLDFRFAEAEAALDTALGCADQPADRARILEQRARLQLAEWRLDQAMDSVRAALAEIGRPLPSNRVWLLIRSVAMLVASVFVHRTGLGFGTADPARAARHRLVSAIYSAGAYTAVRALQPELTLVMDFHARYFVTRLGPSAELVKAIAGWACLVQTATGRPNTRGFARAARLAARVANPVGSAAVDGLRRAADGMTGEPSTDDVLRWTRQHRPVTDAGNALDLLNILLTRLILRGRSAEALAAYRLGATFLSQIDPDTHPFGHLGLAVSATLGRTVDARAALHPFDARVPAATTPGGRMFLLLPSLVLAAEQREYGADFDRLAAELAALRINPRTLLPPMRVMFVPLAYGRLEQCRQAPPAEHQRALAAAEDALRLLGQATTGGGIGAHLAVHHRVGQAQLWQLRGKHRRALDHLAVADRLLCDHDVPWASFEAARIRARTLVALHRMDDALLQATGAIALAESLGWPHRAEWVRAEFRALLPGHSGHSAALSGPLVPGGDHRLMQALEQLSVIASRILDPDELIRVALDETIRILAAERAYLFLTEAAAGSGPAGGLRPHLGRDAAGNDLAALTDYGTTIVERVRLTREPVVVTGTEDGVALGSTSMVVHGLRSIMAAPLQFDGRLLGVVYLDSRVAKGMFASADVGILTALTNHVAAALETARAAQLAVAVQAAEQQRDVADRLRQAMVQISGSLEPAEVLHRLQQALQRLLPGEASCLVRCDDVTLTYTRSVAGVLEQVPFTAGADVRRVLAADFPVVASRMGPDIATALGLPANQSRRTWLGVPLRQRDRLVGALVVAAPATATYGPAEVNLAAMLAGEGMLAFDNAQLFARTEILATRDVLTELSNRRHFFAVAEQDVADAPEGGPDMSVVMLDIDHFKRINDHHGHQVGDEVIRTVASRLAGTLHSGDRLGRYGGEEFAFLLAAGERDAASIGEVLRSCIADEAVETDAGPLPVTVSVGVATFDPRARSFIQALEMADAALYRAKQSGRNRVVTAELPT